MPIGSRFLSDVIYVELLFVIVLGWILVNVWQRVIDNVAYRALKLDDKSVFHTFIVALTLTAIFLVFIFSFDDIRADIIESDNSPIQPPKEE